MKRKYKVSITPSAQLDIAEIWEYISIDSPKNATEFIDQIEKRIYSLENYPTRNPLIPENIFLHTNYRHSIYKDYRLIYRISENDVYILRVIHGSKLLDLD